MGITQYSNALFLLLCIRKEHVDSKACKYEGISIRVIFENALVKRERKRVGNYERKEKIITGCTDIHCTGFGGHCRVTDAEIRRFCGNLYQTIWNDLSEFTEIHCCSNRTVFDYVWNHLDERY